MFHFALILLIIIKYPEKEVTVKSTSFIISFTNLNGYFLTYVSIEFILYIIKFLSKRKIVVGNMWG